MTFIWQEGSKKKFVNTAFMLQPNDGWDVFVEPFAGSAAVGLAFAEIYPNRGLILGDDNEPIINALTQVRDNLKETKEWGERYCVCLQSEEGARWLWSRWVESRDNPSAFSPSQRAALRIHAGPIGSLEAMYSTGRKSGFSAARAGYRGDRRWVGSAADAIAGLDRWHRVIQPAEIKKADYKTTLSTVVGTGETVFAFIDSPYRFAKNGKTPASTRYYGKLFNVDELGPVCQGFGDAGHFVMVTIDWCDENAAMFNSDWTILQAAWTSYCGTKSKHLIAINYQPLITAADVAAICGWKLVQNRR